MPSVSDLTTPQDADGILRKFIELLRLAKFPVSAWQPLSFLRFTVESESPILADIGAVISDIAKGGFTRTATGAWLTLLADSWYALTRKPATFTEGYVTLTDSAGVGPITITAGQLWVADADRSHRYVATSGGTLPLNGSLQVSVRAEAAGVAYSVGNGAITQLVTSQPGVSVANPASGTSGTWITAQGVDEELDEALVQRCLDRWALLGTGSNDGAYRSYILGSSPEITRVRVTSPGGGSVRAIIAGPASPVSVGALASARSIVAQKRPLGVPDVTVNNATATSLTVAAALTLDAGTDAGVAVAAAQAAVSAYLRTLPIGAVISAERIIAALCVPGVANLALTSPTADIVQADDGIAVPTFSLAAA